MVTQKEKLHKIARRMAKLSYDARVLRKQHDKLLSRMSRKQVVILPSWYCLMIDSGVGSPSSSDMKRLLAQVKAEAKA